MEEKQIVIEKETWRWIFWIIIMLSIGFAVLLVYLVFFKTAPDIETAGNVTELVRDLNATSFIR